MPLADGKRSGKNQRRVMAELASGPKHVKELLDGHSERYTREALVNLEKRGLVTARRTPAKATVWALAEEES